MDDKEKKESLFMKLIQSRSGWSSKRICGIVGWLVVMCVMIWCAIWSKEAPVMIDTFMLCCMGLLGIDSVTGIWKK